MTKQKRPFWEDFGPVPFVPSFIRKLLPAHKMVAEIVVFSTWLSITLGTMLIIKFFVHEKIQMALAVPVAAWSVWFITTFYSRSWNLIYKHMWKKRDGIDH